MVKQCKDKSKSPVLFFVDDFCNKWIDINNDHIIQPEEDFGCAGECSIAVYHYLELEILCANNEVIVMNWVR